MAQTQTPRTAAALKSRLDAVYTNQIELAHTAATHATANSFMTGIGDVFCVMVHETDGSMVRNRADRWYNDYRNAKGKGGGPQLAIWADGTVMSLVELPFRTTHGNFQNGRAIGIETGHGNDGRFGDNDVSPDVRAGQASRNGWAPLSANAEDVSGSASTKLFAMHSHIGADPNFQNEVLVAPWTTNNYQTPAREVPGTLQTNMYFSLLRGGPDPNGTYVENNKHWAHAPNANLQPPQPTMMLFTEWQYRSWALCTRYLCEALLIPRNFSVLPHARSDHATAPIFKQVVLADEHFDQLMTGLSAQYHGQQLAFTNADFTGTTAADTANLQRHWTSAHAAANTLDFSNSDLNLGWLRFFDFYRGIHGHAFSGNSLNGQDDHDCPGPLFDWHRFAREVWDWWWFPFDFDSTHATTSVPDRPYRRANGQTPLLEYFFYDQTPAGSTTPDPYLNRTTTPGGIQGAGSSPDTYRLDQNSPVYAMANGELVAAYYPTAGDVSMAFVLVRHEIYHVLDATGVSRQNGATSATDPGHGGLADIGRIDYDREPSSVYSLYMHLGRPGTMSFTQVNDQNPDWLNRVLIRMAECDLALPSTATPPGSLAPPLAKIKADISAPPRMNGGVAGTRATPHQAWQMDQVSYRTFLSDLAAGDVAAAPFSSSRDVDGPTPVRIILGDYLGVAGVIQKQANVATYGLRVEVFSPSLISTDFTEVDNQTSWQVPAGTTKPALKYQSEWSRVPTSTEATALQNIGVDPTAVNWWPSVIMSPTHWDVGTPANAKLPKDGIIFHYKPSDFLQWINDKTWSSEWPKHKVVSGTPPTAVARPASPRPRRF